MTEAFAGVKFSHFGVFVHDLAAMERFYVDLLGFTVTDRGELARNGQVRSVVFLSRDPDEHHQIVLATGRPASLPFNPINQISMRVHALAGLRAAFERFVAAGRQGWTRSRTAMRSHSMRRTRKATAWRSIGTRHGMSLSPGPRPSTCCSRKTA